VYEHCRRSGLQDADAQNVAQNVFFQVLRAMPEFDYDPQRGRFRHWLAVTTHREILQYIKRLQRAGRGQGDGAGDAVALMQPAALDGAWMESLQAHVYQTAVARIRPEFSDDVWEAFERVWVHRQSPREAAEALGKTPQWVYQAKYKVLQRLQAAIEDLAADLPF
jgi:RNA polymerase sigma-70 factor (ECF subfamily)